MGLGKNAKLHEKKRFAFRGLPDCCTLTDFFVMRETDSASSMSFPMLGLIVLTWFPTRSK
jgi:hypothetical protein